MKNVYREQVYLKGTNCSKKGSGSENATIASETIFTAFFVLKV
jgi:hypothetical protein